MSPIRSMVFRILGVTVWGAANFAFCGCGTGPVGPPKNGNISASTSQDAIQALRSLGATVNLVRIKSGQDVPVAVRFSQTGIRDDDLRHLAAVPQIVTLSIHESRITDAGLESLRELKRLRRVSLHCPQVDDAGLVHLREANELEFVSLSHTSIRGTGLNHLFDSPSLVSLNLFGSDIDDSGLRNLEPNGNIRFINLAGTKVTAAGEAFLRKSFPRCYIVRTGF